MKRTLPSSEMILMKSRKCLRTGEDSLEEKAKTKNKSSLSTKSKTKLSRWEKLIKHCNLN